MMGTLIKKITFSINNSFIFLVLHKSGLKFCKINNFHVNTLFMVTYYEKNPIKLGKLLRYEGVTFLETKCQITLSMLPFKKLVNIYNVKS